MRRWRHFDACDWILTLEAQLWRVDCPRCGVVVEQVTWAEPAQLETRKSLGFSPLSQTRPSRWFFGSLVISTDGSGALVCGKTSSPRSQFTQAQAIPK
jgi:hypothetical protein